MYNCALCGIKSCKNNLENAPGNCPSLKDMEEIKETYGTEENYDMAKVAGILAARSDLTRIEETMEFAKACGFKKIGLAFCSALAKETEVISKIFKHNGFEIETIICKVGSISRELIGIDSKSRMCNPIAQAQLFNGIKTDFNVIVGLCIGHDTLFIKYSDAPVTVLVVKDRILAHNPLGAIYLADGFYKNKLFSDKK